MLCEKSGNFGGNHTKRLKQVCQLQAIVVINLNMNGILQQIQGKNFTM